MDLASIIGLVGAVGMVIGSMIAAGGLGPFVDTPSLLIVFGGTFFAVMYKCTMPIFLRSFGAMKKVFMPKSPNQEELITRMVELSDMARKNGLMALENQDVPDPFFSKGLQMLVDGADEFKMSKQLNQEIKAMKTRHEEIHDAIRGWIDIAPAMGMIGTLIGLVQMLRALDDPSKIGGGMAVALLTTLYGAVIANVVCIPLAGKLEARSKEEVACRELMITGITALAKGLAPPVVEDVLVAYLSPNSRQVFQLEKDGG